MRRWKKLGAVLTTMFFLAACGGGGGSAPPPSPAGGSGIAVDPYIVGAVFEEQDAQGNSLQVSNASDESGRFSFPRPFTSGSTLVMTQKGVHNGIPFTGTLKRKVDGGGALVASPLTTLLAEGLSEDQVIELIVPADASDEEKEAMKAKLKADPMVDFDEGDAGLLVAAMSVSVALTAMNNNIQAEGAFQTLKSIVTAVSSLLEDQVLKAESATSTAKVGAAVAIADFLTKKVAEDKTVVVADLVTPELISELIEVAKDGGKAVIEIGENDQPVVAKPDATLAGFLAKGFAAFDKASQNSSTDDLLEAIKNFSAARSLAGIDDTASQNDKDTAYFFGAFARILALANPYSTAVDAGFNTLGDILDAFGFDKGNEVRKDFSLISYPQDCVENQWGWQECESLPLPDDAPTSGEVQRFLFDKLGAELKAAITDFGKVSTSFKKVWADPVDQSATEFDHADMLFMRALAKAMLFQLHVQEAYDLDVDIAAEERDANGAVEYTIEDFLANNPDLGKLKDSAKLADAKVYASGALDDLQAAVVAVENEADNQLDDFINFYTETCTWNPSFTDFSCQPDPQRSAEEIAQMKVDIAEAKRALTGPITTSDGKILDFSKFFAGVDLRAKLPVYEGDKPGMFPDPSLGGILGAGFDINADLDEDGSPDLLMNGFTQFSEAMLEGRYFHIGGYWCGVYGALVLNTNGTFSYDWSYWYGNSVNNQVVGLWTVENGQLLLSNQDSGFLMDATLVEGDGRADGWLFFDVRWTQDGPQECFGWWSSAPPGEGGGAPAPM